MSVRFDTLSRLPFFFGALVQQRLAPNPRRHCTGAAASTKQAPCSSAGGMRPRTHSA